MGKGLYIDRNMINDAKLPDLSRPGDVTFWAKDKDSPSEVLMFEEEVNRGTVVCSKEKGKICVSSGSRNFGEGGGGKKHEI